MANIPGRPGGERMDRAPLSASVDVGEPVKPNGPEQSVTRPKVLKPLDPKNLNIDLDAAKIVGPRGHFMRYSS